MAISKEESNLISYIRFPLAAMVVLWHTPQFYHVPISFSDNAFVILSTLFSLFVGIVVYVSVPAFFLMSGYLFFLNSSDWEGGAFLNSYISKIKKRIFTLLIPYILWNSIAMFLNLVKCIASALINNKSFSEVISWLMDIFPRGYWVANHRFMGFENFLGIRVYECSPYDSPLWFIRDLMVMTIISPFLFYLIKKLKVVFVVILSILYITGIWFQIPGFEIRAVLFFSIGAYLAYNKKSLMQMCKNKSIHIFSVLALVFTIFFYAINSECRFYICRIFILLGTFSIFEIAANVMKRISISPVFTKTTFFIYAAHRIFIIYVVDSIIRVLIVNAYVANVVSILFTPIVTIAIIVMIYKILNKINPKVVSVLSGGR